MRLLRTLPFILLVACKTPSEESAGPPAGPPGGPRLLAEGAETATTGVAGVLLHCIGLQPPRRGGCDKGDPTVNALVLAARDLTNRENREYAIELSMQMRIPDLPISERMIAQNAAFYLATVDWAGRIDAIRLMRDLALGPEAFDQMGEEITPEMGLWLDDVSKWRDLKIAQMPLRHESQMHFTRWYRAVLSGKTRAIVGQLVVMDKAWEPHITPLTGGFEALTESEEDPSEVSACVTELDIEARRCGAAAGLDALMLLNPAPPQLDPFVAPLGAPNKASCLTCHDGPSDQFAQPLRPAEARAHIAARRAVFLREARAELHKLRERLRAERE